MDTKKAMKKIFEEVVKEKKQFQYRKSYLIKVFTKRNHF